MIQLLMKMSINQLSKQEKLAHQTPKRNSFSNQQSDIVHKLSSFHQSPLRYKKISQLKVSLGQGYTTSLKSSFNFQIQQTQQSQTQLTQPDRNPRLLKHYLFKKKPSISLKQSSPKPPLQLSTQQLSHLKTMVQRIYRTQRCKTIASQLISKKSDNGRERIESPDQAQILVNSLILPKVIKINPYSHCKSNKRSRVIFNFSQIQSKPARDSQRLTTPLKEEPKKTLEIQDLGIVQGWNSQDLNDIQSPSFNCGLRPPQIKRCKNKKLRLKRRQI